MRRLVLLRHAKSSWDDLSQSDHARTLNTRGQRAARQLGDAFRALGLSPDRVLCSTATRTRETWDLLAEGLGAGAPSARYFNELYLADPDRLLAVAKQEGEAAQTLLIVGHNDGLHEFALGLVSDASELALRDKLSMKFPTAALAVFDCPVEGWEHLAWHQNSLVHLRFPRDDGEETGA